MKYSKCVFLWCILFYLFIFYISEPPVYFKGEICFVDISNIQPIFRQIRELGMCLSVSIFFIKNKAYNPYNILLLLL